MNKPERGDEPRVEVGVNGVVFGPASVEAFTDALIDWCEANGWTWGGTTAPADTMFPGQPERVAPCEHSWRFVADGLLWTYPMAQTGGSTTRTERGYYCTRCLAQRRYEAAHAD